MARFFFDIIERDAKIEDMEGIDLPDAAAAHRAAVAGARGLLCDAIRHGRLPLTNAILIRDETTATVTRVTFADAVEIE